MSLLRPQRYSLQPHQYNTIMHCAIPHVADHFLRGRAHRPTVIHHASTKVSAQLSLVSTCLVIASEPANEMTMRTGQYTGLVDHALGLILLHNVQNNVAVIHSLQHGAALCYPVGIRITDTRKYKLFHVTLLYYAASYSTKTCSNHHSCWL